MNCPKCGSKLDTGYNCIKCDYRYCKIEDTTKMKQFNSIEEMEKYLNKETKTYEFIENGELLDIEITFDLTINKSILASNIDARNIDAQNIYARNIKAWDIKVNTIRANTILFNVVCYAYNSIICEYIKGTHRNSKYFSLYGEVIIKEEK